MTEPRYLFTLLIPNENYLENIIKVSSFVVYKIFRFEFVVMIGYLINFIGKIVKIGENTDA